MLGFLSSKWLMKSLAVWEEKQRHKVIFSLFQDTILIGHGKHERIKVAEVSPEKEFVPLHYSIKGRCF